MSGGELQVQIVGIRTSPVITLSIFDGDLGGDWDYVKAPGTKVTYKLYADRDADGTGTHLLQTWTSDQMNDNDWWTTTLTPTGAARSPAGHFFYRLSVTLDDPTAVVLHAFKVRTTGALVLKSWQFAFMAVGRKVFNGAITFDGSWDLFLNVPDPVHHFAIWDGDFDYGRQDTTTKDTDDPDTPNAVPSFSSGGSMNPEGVAIGKYCKVNGATTAVGCTGAPSDNNLENSFRLRGDATGAFGGDVWYQLRFPDGRDFVNSDPSGNQEWEQFRVETNHSLQADHYTNDQYYPAGVYKIEVRDLDAANLNAWFVDHDVLGMNPGGSSVATKQPYPITGFVWNDANGNGLVTSKHNQAQGKHRDAAAQSEPGLPGITMTLLTEKGEIEDQAVSDADGEYRFEQHAGDFILTVDPVNFQAGGPLEHYTPTTAAGTSVPVTLTKTQSSITDANFGFSYQPTPAILGDMVFEDTNGDGAYQTGEPGIQDVVVELYISDGAGGWKFELSTTSDSTGFYKFEEHPGTFKLSLKASNANSGMPLDGRTATTAVSFETTVTAGQLDQGHDFGFSAKVLYTLGDLVFEDGNKNGKQDAGEAGLQGVVVTLHDAAGHEVGQATTDANGAYLFDGNSHSILATSGEYSVRISDDSFAAGAVLEGRDYTTAQEFPAHLTAANHQMLTGDFGFSTKAVFTIGDTVFTDADSNGAQGAGESGLAGVTVLLLDGSAAGHPTLQTKTTDASGKYSFTVTAGGKYMVELEPTQFHSGNPLYLYAVTSGNAVVDVTVTNAARDVATVDFGVLKQVNYGTIGDKVFSDTNGDGTQQAGEPGVAGVLVELRQGAHLLATDLTDATGTYRFDHGAGDYEVRVASLNFAVGNPLASTVPTTALGVSRDLSVVNGVTDDTTDFGFQTATATGTETGAIWEDTDRDGVKDPGETGIAGVTVELLLNGHIYLTAETDATGTYTFAAPPGDYSVLIEPSRNYDSGEPLEGRTPTTPQTTPATVATGAVSTANFGFSPKVPVIIGDQVFHDADADGEMDQGEAGINNVQLNLIDSVGNTVDTTTTNADGTYFFEVHPGTYTVQLDSSNFATGGALESATPLQADVESTHTVNYQSAGVFSADFRYAAPAAICRCQAGYDDGATACGVIGCSLPGFATTLTSFSPPTPWDMDTEVGKSNYVKNADGTVSILGGKWLCTDVVVQTAPN